MSQYWSPIVSTLKPYVAGEQPRIQNLVKLNTNENPYGPSPKAVSAIQAAADDALRLYPDPSATALREAIAVRFGVQADQVFVGNGSDEVLAHTFQALLKHDEPLLYPDITYSFYPTYSRLYDIDVVEIPLDGGFRIRPADYDRPCGAIIIPNPNAPTGIGLALPDIEALVAAHPDVPVVVDEAYIDFGGETVAGLIGRYPNLLVIQTLSKSRSLAGMRVGFALGQRHLVDALERVKDSFNSYPLDRLAQVAATAAIEDAEWFETCRQKIIATRDRVSGELQAMGFDVLPSQANFVYAKHPALAGAEVYSALRAEGVLVRHWNKPRIADYLRISIGTDAECDRLLDVLKNLPAAG
ncbi:histidinol-phosphate transaminase [Neorhizobium galegae]|uniref:Histidinol-phosphate aminotransferase n=1 Tax=Neorhizobium galegae TaxID=399 RepID=A0A6A1U0C7_NEOGA|nr:histidinol-phosphate transaminase [Neorhizobium galegae]KAB1088567.1 histidinol-phosphate transaminase [Neorhizobium galegae]